MAKPKRPADVPILTETVDSSPLDLPTLTDAVEGHLASLSVKECQLIAEKLLPELEQALLNALAASPQSDWDTAMQQVRRELPHLLHKAARDAL
jgi:hypothetical protein